MSTKPLIFSPDTLVRFRTNRILIHTTASALPAYETDHPMLVGWLCQFCRPTLLSAALGGIPEPDRNPATEVVRYLQRSGVLIEAESEPPPDASQSHERTRRHLKMLARSVYDAACDIQGLGVHGESLLSKRTGIGIERRLMGLLTAVDSLRRELGSIRAEHVREQLETLGVGSGGRALKLHLGCADGHLSGWVNIDVAPAPLALNVLAGLPFPDGSVSHVYASHLLEHLFYPVDVERLLGEVRRVLSPGGLFRIVVPDIEQCIEAYVKNDPAFFARRRETWDWWPENPTRLEDFLAYSGAGPEPALLFESHKYGYDFETLQQVLAKAGFTDVVRSTFMGSMHETLRVDDVSSVARARYGDRYYSLFVEARHGNG